MENYLWWLILAGFFFVLEFVTEGFLICWFGVGALAAMITSFIWPEATVAQIIVFGVVSAILVLFTRKFSKKVEPKAENTSNVYSILGKEAIVTVEIDNNSGKGQVKIDGDVWSAKSETGEKISLNSKVEIIKIDGVKAVVKQK